MGLDDGGVSEEREVFWGGPEGAAMEVASGGVSIKVVGLEGARDAGVVELFCELSGGCSREGEQGVDWTAGIDESCDEVNAICECSMTNWVR